MALINLSNVGYTCIAQNEDNSILPNEEFKKNFHSIHILISRMNTNQPIKKQFQRDEKLTD
ncbi:hypothetical protein Smp_000210 [Schistosoma mansoni]|uniref:hypothetical protein n=1 Tax=Schistosoma mansoni TaxID=6183 RepID=UPI00022C8470|nr:hypothetical protein Smp_000210 [Schistosoma mansoni]|eukprot:XP_018645377.1 hypothetical protein Smp_000210 [Schistosoma mansoni]